MLLSEGTLSSGREFEFGKALPNMLPGWVCEQYVRRGKKLCGPYWYRFWREGGRLRKAYVKPHEIEAVRARCSVWQEGQTRMRAFRQREREARALYAKIRRLLRVSDAT